MVAITLGSCSSEDSNPTVNELDGLTKFKEIENDTHTIELYSYMKVEQGYNEIAIKIKNKSTGQYIKDAEIEWLPMMHMKMMSHSCPSSEVKTIGTSGTVYAGNIVFQMAENDEEYWDLKIDYKINGIDYTMTSSIDVPASNKQRVTSFTGTDNARYVLALVQPKNPRVALNDMVVGLYKMNTMTSFSVVDNFTIKIDPRMPSMGNHGSPNNVDLKQSATDQLYHGKMALTMTGYWKINLQLLNEEDEVLKGETITNDVPQSSLYLEVEF